MRVCVCVCAVCSVCVCAVCSVCSACSVYVYVCVQCVVCVCVCVCSVSLVVRRACVCACVRACVVCATVHGNVTAPPERKENSPTQLSAASFGVVVAAVVAEAVLGVGVSGTSSLIPDAESG